MLKLNARGGIYEHLFRLQVHIDGQLNEKHPHPHMAVSLIESGSILKIRSYDVVTAILVWCMCAVKFSWNVRLILLKTEEIVSFYFIHDT